MILSGIWFHFIRFFYEIGNRLTVLTVFENINITKILPSISDFFDGRESVVTSAGNDTSDGRISVIAVHFFVSYQPMCE